VSDRASNRKNLPLSAGSFLYTAILRHHQTWFVDRKFYFDPAHNQGYQDFQDAVRAQDTSILEGRRARLLPPFWTKIELPLRPADQPLVEYQKWLEALEISVSV
jgi:vanillate O-demethylase monooxygenase subunit